MELKQILTDKFCLSADFLNNALIAKPDIAVIAGSGVADAISDIEVIQEIPYSSIPNFFQSSIIGHKNSIQLVEIEKRKVLIFTGRFHLYEGFSILQNISPVALSYLLGVKNIILTNAAGGLSPYSNTGDIMLINDFINFSYKSLFAELKISNQTVKTITDLDWQSAIKKELIEMSIPFIEGAYIMVMGPNYETPAEIRAYRKTGGHAIGMSTIFEYQTANLLGMNATACSIITNKLSEPYAGKVSHSEVITAAERANSSINAFIRTACKTI